MTSEWRPCSTGSTLRGTQERDGWGLGYAGLSRGDLFCGRFPSPESAGGHIATYYGSNLLEEHFRLANLHLK